MGPQVDAFPTSGFGAACGFLASCPASCKTLATTKTPKNEQNDRIPAILQNVSTTYEMRLSNSVRGGRNHAACAITGCPHCAQRRASIGISLKHSGHFLVVGSAGAGAFLMRATSRFTGVTTK